MADPETPLPPPVKGLAAVSLFNDFASEMVYPVLPAFVTGTLGASPLALGALDGAAELTASVVKWWSGRMADRPGWAKPLIVLGYSLAILIRPLIAVAGAAWQVIGFRVIDRVGKGLRSPPRDALIVTLTPRAQGGRAFGLTRAADHAGAVLGSLVAWAMLSGGSDTRSVIAWSVLPGVAAAAVLLLALKGVHDRPRESVVPQGAAPATAHGRAFWIPVSLLVLFAVGRLPETLLLLRIQELGVSVAAIPLVWAGLHVVRSSASYPGGRLTDRIGPRGAVALGAACYVLAAAGLALVAGATAAVAVFLGYGLVAGLVEPAERVAIARLAPVRPGKGFGSYQGLTGLAALPAGLGFGAVYRSLGAPAALALSALAIIGCMTLWLLVGRTVLRRVS
ncbi:MAG: MFS transporter [Gemmatimonadales bacterium]|nr:MFS transporter [Gemmatimonadales bacterium]